MVDGQHPSGKFGRAGSIPIAHGVDRSIEQFIDGRTVFGLAHHMTGTVTHGSFWGSGATLCGRALTLPRYVPPGRPATWISTRKTSSPADNSPSGFNFASRPLVGTNLTRWPGTLAEPPGSLKSSAMYRMRSWLTFGSRLVSAELTIFGASC